VAQSFDRSLGEVFLTTDPVGRVVVVDAPGSFVLPEER
jgi:hypothetical protein